MKEVAIEPRNRIVGLLTVEEKPLFEKNLEFHAALCKQAAFLVAESPAVGKRLELQLAGMQDLVGPAEVPQTLYAMVARIFSVDDVALRCGGEVSLKFPNVLDPQFVALVE